jgi:hypothetical protein
VIGVRVPIRRSCQRRRAFSRAVTALATMVRSNASFAPRPDSCMKRSVTAVVVEWSRLNSHSPGAGNRVLNGSRRLKKVSQSRTVCSLGLCTADQSNSAPASAVLSGSYAPAAWGSESP